MSDDEKSNYKKNCFVIMPFSQTSSAHTESYWNKFYSDFLKPKIQSLGFLVTRSEAATGKISKGIVQDLAYSDLVFAVLTDNNPNVWYELGVRHASRLGTIMAIEKNQDVEKVPFDVKDYGIIRYDMDVPDQFKMDLKRHIDSIPTKDSAVADFLKIEPNIAVNMAIGTVRESARLILSTYEQNGRAGLGEVLREFQSSLPKTMAQVSVLEKERFLFHADEPLPALERCWVDVIEPGASFLPIMRRERNGLRIGTIKDIHDRMTVIAYETLAHPDCLIVAEGHYWQEGSRPY